MEEEEEEEGEEEKRWRERRRGEGGIIRHSLFSKTCGNRHSTWLASSKHGSLPMSRLGFL